MRAAVLATLILSSIARAQPAAPPSRRHHARALEARQGGLLEDVQNLAGVNSTVSSASSDGRDSAPPTSSATSIVSSTSSAVITTPSPEPSTTSDTSTSIAPTSSDRGILDGLLGNEESASPTPSFAPTTSSPTVQSASSVSQGEVTRTVTRVSSSASAKSLSSASSLPSAAADSSKKEDEKIGGLPKTTFIIIIAVASAVVLIALAWTAFRKWKLRPSQRFGSKMKPVNFDPNGMRGGDDYFEKTLQRSPSHSSLDRQRQQFIADLDKNGPDYVEGVPQHDFTAGTGMYDDNTYSNDSFAHSAAYDYDTSYYHQAIAQPAPALHSYPAQDYPTQDQPVEGYNDLQRGNSGNSGSSHGSSHGGQVRPSDFPTPDQYIGRPTEGEGPYAQASRTRY